MACGICEAVHKGRVVSIAAVVVRRTPCCIKHNLTITKQGAKLEMKRQLEGFYATVIVLTRLP
jgi:hypothetical protein